MIRKAANCFGATRVEFYRAYFSFHFETDLSLRVFPRLVLFQILFNVSIKSFQHRRFKCFWIFFLEFKLLRRDVRSEMKYLILFQLLILSWNFK